MAYKATAPLDTTQLLVERFFHTASNFYGYKFEVVNLGASPCVMNLPFRKRKCGVDTKKNF